jgi:hypothetical protein
MDQTARNHVLVLRTRVAALFSAQVAAMSEAADFQDLEAGRASRERYDAFLENVARAHLRSPQLVAFLYSIAPPAAAESVLHNLLEELGLEDEGDVAHPALLRELIVGAGLGHRLPEIEWLAKDDLRRVVVDPILYGTLRDVGLAALTEIVAFEFMLSRLSSRIATALERHRGLAASTLRWFTHHSEVDVAHAEQGLDGLAAYVRYYGIPEDEALTIVEMTLRENVFLRRYFRESLAASTGSGR